MKVQVHIDNIVVKSLVNSSTAAFTHEIQQELSRLIREKGINGIPTTGVLDTETINVVYGSKIEPMGAQVARSIYQSLNKNG